MMRLASFRTERFNGRSREAHVKFSQVRLLATALVVLAGTAALAQVLSLESSYVVPANDPVIRYREVGSQNAVARLQERLASRQLRLAYDLTSGYLPAVLSALDIPQSSQVLVFSKTSFQAPRIERHSPRALLTQSRVAARQVPAVHRDERDHLVAVSEWPPRIPAARRPEP